MTTPTYPQGLPPRGDLTAASGAPASNLSKSPLHLLHRAGQRAGDVFQTEMAAGDLTPRQYAVLVTVSRNEGLSQTNLVELTGIDRSTLADIIRRMLKKGLLQRRRTKEDARAYAVKLTDEGRKVLDNAEPLADRVDERVLSVLPDQQRDQFLRDLNLIIEALGRVDLAREAHTGANPVVHNAPTERAQAPATATNTPTSSDDHSAS